MKRVNRRTFLQWLAPGTAVDPHAVNPRAVDPRAVDPRAVNPLAVEAQAPFLASAAPGVEARKEPLVPSEPALPTAVSGFSLEAFYAARSPQILPPIAIRPSVLHYAGELTSVGCAPPHQPPALEGDPLYARLAADAACVPPAEQPAEPSASPAHGRE